MNIINTRSPYFITVNETSQIGSKIELFIWNYPSTIPSTANYTLSKKIPSLTQTSNIYNISSFINEYIDNVSVNDSTDLMYANILVKVYKEVTSGVYSLTRTEEFIGVNGYNYYTDGYNKINTNTKIVVLTNPSKVINYNRSNSIPYINILVDSILGDKLELNYTDARGRNLVNTILINTTDVATKRMLKIPVSTSLIKYDEQNNLEIKYTNGLNIYTFNYKAIAICENKYTPVVCSFINRNGGWEFLTFFKAQTNSIEIKSTSFKLSPDSINYNVLKGQTKNFNTNGSQTIKLNTGWIEEIHNETIQELMLSETILLDNKPVTIKTKSNQLKTDLNDKNINYAIDFDYSFDLLNNVI